ncbi:MAG: flavin-containing monooxygenase [Acidimicrobiales bacterium]
MAVVHQPANPAAERDRPDHRVVVVGAGLAGIGMAVALRRAGIEDFCVLEKGDRIGGVWRDNTYPGAACDVPSHLYCFSSDQPHWTRRYSAQPEILDYVAALAARHGVGPRVRLRTEVTAARFDEACGWWAVELAGGGRTTAQVLVSAVGQLNRPAFPDLAGRDRVAGASWHSARWARDGADVTGERVAVIGTGASAIQFVPQIAKQAVSVHVFQRSAPYVMPKRDPVWSATASALFRRVPGLRRLDRLRVFLGGELLTAGYVAAPSLARHLTTRWRHYMESQIADPALRLACTPDYTVGCKRILFSSDWYPTLRLPHVHLVTDPITEITETGLRCAGGTDVAVDAIVYGTGFKASEFLQPMAVTGRGARALHEVWAAGAQAHLGVAVSGFPNLFLLYGPNTNLGGNSVLYMIETQIAYVLQALDLLDRERLAWIDARPDVQAAFGDWVDRTSERTVYRSGCHSWYTTASGRNTNNWPTFTFRYRRRLAALERSDYQVQPAGAHPLPAVAGG